MERILYLVGHGAMQKAGLWTVVWVCWIQSCSSVARGMILKAVTLKVVMMDLHYCLHCYQICVIRLVIEPYDRSS